MEVIKLGLDLIDNGLLDSKNIDWFIEAQCDSQPKEKIDFFTGAWLNATQTQLKREREIFRYTRNPWIEFALSGLQDYTKVLPYNVDLKEFKERELWKREKGIIRLIVEFEEMVEIVSLVDELELWDKLEFKDLTIQLLPVVFLRVNVKSEIGWNFLLDRMFEDYFNNILYRKVSVSRFDKVLKERVKEFGLETHEFFELVERVNISQFKDYLKVNLNVNEDCLLYMSAITFTDSKVDQESFAELKEKAKSFMGWFLTTEDKSAEVEFGQTISMITEKFKDFL